MKNDLCPFMFELYPKKKKKMLLYYFFSHIYEHFLIHFQGRQIFKK